MLYGKSLCVKFKNLQFRHPVISAILQNFHIKKKGRPFQTCSSSFFGRFHPFCGSALAVDGFNVVLRSGCCGYFVVEVIQPVQSVDNSAFIFVHINVEIVFLRGVRLFMTEHLHQHKHIHVIKSTSRSIGVTEVVIAEFYARFRFDFLCPVFHGIDRQQLPVVLSVDEVTTCKPFL